MLKKEKKKKREKQALPAQARPGISITPGVMVPDVPIDGSTFDADSPVGMENLRLAMNELGGKWRLQVLWSLRSGDGLRYVGIKNTIPGITDMMLSQSLRELCQSGLAERQQYQEIPPRVEYRILPDGAALIPIIRGIIDWQENREFPNSSAAN